LPFANAINLAIRGTRLSGGDSLRVVGLGWNYDFRSIVIMPRLPSSFQLVRNVIETLPLLPP
jgi:hypothetical protein